jgi:hypothetical protein
MMMPIPLDFLFSDRTLDFVLPERLLQKTPEPVTDAERIAENPDQDRTEN